MTIDPASMKVILHESLSTSPYAQYNSKKLRLPKKARHHPSRKALECHRAKHGL
jgi:hypothetical protein